MAMKTSRILAIHVVVTLIHNFNCEPVVEIGESQIFGKTVDYLKSKVNQYLSIPYAQPPVGELRFQPTVPIGQLPRKLNAFDEPPACPQYTDRPFPWYVNSSKKSEDCLYLNIWTPPGASPKKKKAVMYWVHGGGYRYGSMRTELYNGTFLSALGDIIVVTVNYRVGPFGFLASGTNDAPGNAGLWDILEGLRWVNRNIEYFGGDVRKITLAGESVGAMSVGFMSISPLAKGLYSRQIMESGAPNLFTLEAMKKMNVDLAQQLAKEVNCANDTFTIQKNPGPVVKCLKGVNSTVLSKADFRILPDSSLDFFPTFGDKLLPENPKRAVLSGNFHCTDLLMGNNEGEGSFQVTTTNPQVFGFFGEKDPQINKTMGSKLIRKLFFDFSDPKSVDNYYLPSSVKENDYDYIRQQVLTAIGDELFFCPCRYYSEECAEKGNKVYYYLWRHRPSTTPWAPWMGVAHFSEVQFVFGFPLQYPSSYEANEIPLSQKIIKIWSNFVKNGNPGIPWPRYTKRNVNFKYLGPGLNTGRNDKGPHIEGCEFFRSYNKQN